MADIATLGIAVDASSANKAVTALNRLEKQASATESGVNLLKRAFQGLTIGATIGKLVSTQRQFDVLNASLVTVTGSSQAAEREFAWIKDFAATTPFALNEVTQAFIKLKALGLDATQDTLTSYGNTASAFGKSLEQFIEAVADASTGEFERLKEFGIKARQDGEIVKLTFQGITTTIGNNAAEITRYLDDIGNNQFAGAMQRRAESLDGALSNLGDTWDELFRTVNRNATGSVIADSVKLASGAIGDLITILNEMNRATGENARQTGFLKTAQEGLAVVLETIAALGVNVAYVLEATGREIGGLVAQRVALLKLDFKGFNFIGEAMREDAKAAREEVDRLTDSILNARKRAAQDSENKQFGEDLFGGSIDKFVEENTPKKAGGGSGAGEVDKSAAAAARRAAKEANDQRILAAEQVLGLDEASLKRQADITRAYEDFDRKRSDANEKAIEAGNRQAEQLKDMADRYRDLGDPVATYIRQIQEVTALEAIAELSAEEAFNARLKLYESADKASEGLKDKVKEQKTLAEELGLTFQSAAEDAIVSFKSLGDVIEGVLKDILRIAVRRNITEPLGNALGSIFGGIFGGTKKAAGGYISGPGTSTSDSIPARLSNGEYVVRASAVKKIGVGALDAINSGMTPRRFNQGGFVGSAPSGSMRVQIINNTPAQVTTRQTGDGGLQVLIENLEAELGSRLANGVGGLNSAVQGRFGLKPSMGF